MAAVEEADELRADCSHLLRDHHPPTKVKVTPAENRAIKELREDQSRVVWTADKGVAMEVMDKQYCKDKALSLLPDTNTYRTINKDPTTRLRNHLIDTLKDIKQTGGPRTQHTKKVYPTSTVPPKVLWPSQNSQGWHPLRHIVFSRGSITYGMSKVLAGIISPLVGQSPHHLRNTQHFVELIEQVKLEPGETITSFDVKALSTSVPVDSSIQIVLHRLSQDTTLHKGPACPSHKSSSCWSSALNILTSSSRVSIMNRSMVQPWVPHQPLIANLFMEEFEVITAKHSIYNKLAYGAKVVSSNQEALNKE